MTTNCPRCGITHEKCSAHNSQGNPCGNRAMKGQTVCRNHGGSAPAAKAKAVVRLAAAAAAEAVGMFGLPVEIDPHTALLQELYRTQGAVVWLMAQVNLLEPGSIVWGKTSDKKGGQDWGIVHTAAIDVWVQLLLSERRHLLDVSKACIAAGIEEKRVELETARVALMAKGAERLLAYVPAESRDEAIRVFLDELRSLEAAS